MKYFNINLTNFCHCVTGNCYSGNYVQKWRNGTLFFSQPYGMKTLEGN
jgi:hypothetical protein